MKIKKILLAGLLASGMLLSACGNSEPEEPAVDIKGEYEITVWVSEVSGVAELTERQIRAFEAANEGVKIKETIEKVTEADAATKMLTDVTEGADIFCFAQDQFARLVQGGALQKLGKSAARTIQEANDAGSVGAVKSGADYYAYPMTSDNGYFMYYDKSVVKEAHLNSLEDIIEDCRAAGMNFSMELQTSAWYLASFFFGTGCVSEWQTNNKGKFVSYNDTFNSDKGVIAAKGMKKLLDYSGHISSSNVGDFTASTPSAVVVSGTWAFNDAKTYLGDNLGAAKLPSFTVDGQSYQMGSYSGYKLLGV
jgi:arabinogalactan oligomer/maltooligosaccharide transport system substrate-binding protein